MTNVFVTGVAGFIGSTLAERLLSTGHSVTGYDNFSTGQREFLSSAAKHQDFRLVEGDNLDLPALTRAMAGTDTVFHLAANADVRFGLEHPSKDVQQNTLATFNVLEAMRANGITPPVRSTERLARSPLPKTMPSRSKLRCMPLPRWPVKG